MTKKSKVVFLDRDGVINLFPGDGKYVNSWREFKFLQGSIEGIKKLNSKGFVIFVISNQSGVGRGLYNENDLNNINKVMLDNLKKHNACFTGIYYCTHHPKDNCDCRKPKIGLLKKAIADSGIIPEISFFVGDSFLDMKTAKDFGAKSILVLSGKEKISNRDNWEFTPDYIFNNLLEAADYLCSRYE